MCQQTRFVYKSPSNIIGIGSRCTVHPSRFTNIQKVTQLIFPWKFVKKKKHKYIIFVADQGRFPCITRTFFHILRTCMLLTSTSPSEKPDTSHDSLTTAHILNSSSPPGGSAQRLRAEHTASNLILEPFQYPPMLNDNIIN